MKNKKRLITYATLALPFLVFIVFVATLDPVAREGFWQEFAQNTRALFAGDDVQVPAATPSTPGGEASDPPSASVGRRRGPGGRGFDPVAVFERRDEDGDGKLTGGEISERMRENLDTLDADQDGGVTLKEFQEGMPAVFASRGGGRRQSGQSDDNSDSTSGNGGESDALEDRPNRPE